jgi:hypothetical protein
VYSVVLVANCRAPVDERVAAELLCAPDDDGSVGESGVFDFVSRELSAVEQLLVWAPLLLPHPPPPTIAG